MPDMIGCMWKNSSDSRAHASLIKHISLTYNFQFEVLWTSRAHSNKPFILFFLHENQTSERTHRPFVQHDQHGIIAEH